MEISLIEALLIKRNLLEKGLPERSLIEISFETINMIKISFNEINLTEISVTETCFEKNLRGEKMMETSVIETKLINAREIGYVSQVSSPDIKMTGKQAKRANQEEVRRKHQRRSRTCSERNTSVLRGVPLENAASLRVVKKNRCETRRRRPRKSIRIIQTKSTCLKLPVRTFREHDPHEVQQGVILMNSCGAARRHIKNRSASKSKKEILYV